MSKKTIYATVRIVAMAIALTILRQLYEIGAAGYILVGLVGIVWSVTAAIENDYLEGEECL